MKKSKTNIIKQLLLCSLISITIFTSGCSYKAIDNALNEEINQGLEVATYKETEENQIHYIKKGDSIPDYSEYAIDGNKNSIGIKGLEYTINNVHIYGSINDTKIKKEDCDPMFHNSKKIWDENKFILVDMTATYNGTELVMPQMDFFVKYFTKKEGYPEIDEDTEKKLNTDLIYFSEHACDGDKNVVTGDKMKQEIDYYLFRNGFETGEAINFQLGIVLSNKLIEDKNGFLVLHYAYPPEDVMVDYFDLIGGADEKSSKE